VKESMMMLDQVIKLASLGDMHEVGHKAFESWSRPRQVMARVVTSNFMAVLMAIVLVCNIAVVLVEADNVAKCAADENMCSTHFYVRVIDRVCTGCYIVEVVLRLYVFRGTFHHSCWNVVDSLLVGISVVGEFFSSVMQNAVLLRLIRALRIMRVLRLLSMFQELYLLMLSLASTMRTIFWSCIMLGCVMSVFAILAIEVLRPVHSEVIAERIADGTIDECYRCEFAFDSVAHCVVTLFVTLVLGDGIWDILVPMIDRDFRAGICILGFVVTVYLGFSNLILSVIVDKANEARCQDMTYQTMNTRRKKREARRELRALWNEVGDGDSDISLDELQKLWASSDTFHDYFKSMDIDMSFLQYALQIMDTDNDGLVTFEEFAESVVRLKNTDAGPVIAFVKHQSSQMMSELIGLKDQLCSFQQNMVKMVDIPKATTRPASDTTAEQTSSSWRKMQHLEGDGIMFKASNHIEETIAARENSADDLIDMLKSAYEDPLPINLPNLRGPERVFADHCQRVEVQLGRLMSNPINNGAAQLELYLCSARLLAAVSKALPKMLPRFACHNSAGQPSASESQSPNEAVLVDSPRSGVRVMQPQSQPIARTGLKQLVATTGLRAVV